MAVNHSSRLKLVLTILLSFVSVLAAQAQSSDGQSLGDLARNQRDRKPAAKVIDDDEMVRRGFAHSSVPLHEFFNRVPVTALRVCRGQAVQDGRFCLIQIR